VTKEHPLDDAALLRLVIDGTVSETGTPFFRVLVRNLCQALGTMAAWVTEYDREEHRLRAHAMWAKGAYVDHYEYDLAGTPCQPVVETKRLIHIPERLIELFPIDSDLLDMGAVSYLGMPILDTSGDVIGHLGLLDDKPMPRDPQAVALFEIFAARATGEMRRLRAEAALRARERQLSQLLNSAMDAIIVLDRELAIHRINPAAETLFGCRPEDLLGEAVQDFLVKDSGQRLESIAEELRKRPAGRKQIWIPKGLIVRRWNNSVFPAEATLSCFETEAGEFMSLILRNADERLEAERQIQLLMQETDFLRQVAGEAAGDGTLFGRSDCMKTVTGLIRQVAPTDSTVLITGETGTGKELAARQIHRQSQRAARPLILVNCAAIPANLIESEFFGHEKGAFTGAIQQREGRFKLADGGTIFLDEVGELPLELQAKLLRVLQEGEFTPLGSARTIKVDVRVIAATHRNLHRMATEGDFREDLYFRLNVFPIEIPPLRQRGRDIEELANAFVQRFASRMGKLIEPLDGAQVAALTSYDWPGNVRELQNVIERAVILTPGTRLALERAMSGVSRGDASQPAEAASGARILTAREMERAERANLLRALEACDWKVSGESGAARLLGIPPTTLASRIRKFGLQRPAGA
jgi:PAS domain S-box-containing protein